jgi:Holliday junction DNA helicase RuvA
MEAMIGRLRGEIVYKRPPQLMLDVAGVGYEVEAPMSTFYALPEVGAKATLLTHLAVRDDAHVLYGFAKEGERELFRSLLKVSGVGAKMALAILSGMNSEEFARCVQAADIAALTRLPGVGKKTAERLVVEMRDRLEQIGTVSGAAVAFASNVAPKADSPETEAVSALVALGYKPAEAERMIRRVDAPGGNSEQLIRAALKAVARS